MKIIRTNSKLYEVKEIYHVPEKLWTDLVEGSLRKNTDIVLRNGDVFYACNEIEEGQFIEIKYKDKIDNKNTSTETSGSGTTS